MNPKPLLRMMFEPRSAIAGGWAMVRSGLVRPILPTTAVRMLRAWLTYGSSLATLFAVAAARWPDRVALIDDRGRLRYRELDDRAATTATWLRHTHGVGPDAGLAIMCRNGRDFVEGLLAAARLGADALFLNTEFTPEILAKTLQHHTIGAVLADPEFTERFRAAGYDAPVVTEQDIDRTTTPWRSRPPRAGRIVILTSGTTGVPKGVPRTPSALEWVGIGMTVVDRMRMRVGNRTLIAIPLFHGFGLAFLVITTLLGGTTIVRARYTAQDVLADLDTYRVEQLATVPILLRRITDLPAEVRDRYDHSRLRAVLSGGSPLNPVLAERFMSTFGDLLYNGYGSSEVGVASLATPADLRAEASTVGRAMLGAPVHILDENDRRLPPGRTGRIFVGGGQAFSGYSGGGHKTVVAGLLSTGDLGHLDRAGRLYVEGREDDMIVSGGENVFPQEVENVLARHPEVTDLTVIGVPDDEYGQRLAAYVVAAPGSTVTTDDLRDYLAQAVTRYQRPRDVVLVDGIPRNPAGKVLRTHLARQ